MALSLFSPAVRAWFESSFPGPTAAQAEGWPAIAAGEHTLILAPTGSGKTLAAFLWSIDRLVVDAASSSSTDSGRDREHRTRVVYLSPLRALAVDVEKNLRAPLAGIRSAAERLGLPFREPTIGVRTGDTPADVRRRLLRDPPDILVTTPESLYLMLTSRARESLQGVETVIVDEIHALVPTKRGAHMALSLERLEEIAEGPVQRIGLSATQRPLDVVARFLGGLDVGADGDGGPAVPRPVAIVDAGVRKQLDVEVVVPIDDMGELGDASSIWPSIHPELLKLVEEHTSTLIFVNARRLAERLATRLNELWTEGRNRAAEAEGRSLPEGLPELVKAHHGSLSRERRLQIEDELKSGRLRGLVATSSLELGIDMGAVDLVIQVESPGAVSRGLQRIGRAGHQVGEPSRGKLFPKHRHDLLEAAVVTQRMRDGLIESTKFPRNPLDVLCQHIVAMVAMDDWPVDDLARLVRRAAPFAELSDELLDAVLDLLSGRYPSDEFSELRPRVVWDRIEGRLRARAGAQRLAVTNPGTIPDRGLYGVFLPDGTRVGELDEEMVYESRVGETFLLGATTWRIQEITHERVVVTPAPGQPGKMPFWHGDGPGRPLELGQALGEFTRSVRALEPATAVAQLMAENDLDQRAAANLVAYLAEQAEVTGVVPDDRTIVVERFPDELGDWRVCVLSPFGAQVHAPWAMALQHKLGERWGMDVELMWSDDGIVIRLPEAVDELPVDDLAIDPDELDDLVVARLPSTAMFAGRFRECAARALLLPRRRPDRRTPLWQQRQRSADLLAVAGKYPSFPLLLETTRECINDVFDLPALRGVLTDIRSRRVRVVGVETPRASPFAQSLLFGWIAVYMYGGDAPLAERRAAALALDRDLLADLLGAEELRELLDADALADLELELQCLVPGRRARDPDELHDLLRRLGPLTPLELDARSEGAAGASWAERLVVERRAIWGTVAGDVHLCGAEDAGRLRDALGVAVPMGLAAAFTEPVDDPLVDLVGRYARTHGPFVVRDVVGRLGVTAERVAVALRRLETEGRVVAGEFRPGGIEREHCDVGVLRQLRRRSLAKLRHEVEPVDGATYARFLQQWHGVGSSRTGLDALVDVVGQLQGLALPASALESEVLPARLRDFSPADLDQLCTLGELVWVGAGALGATDGRLRLLFREQAGLLLPGSDEVPDDPLAAALLAGLRRQGASFWHDLLRMAQEAGQPYDDVSVLAALWDLVWSGQVTNDSLAPMRSFVSGKVRRSQGGRRRPERGRLARVGPPQGAGRWSPVSSLSSRPLAAAAPSGVGDGVGVPSTTEALHALAGQLLERHGVLTREAARSEGIEGGFAGIYPVLKALEERGRVRRGYFVAGQGAAQFALPGAVDRLRAARSGEGTTVVLAATDPAQPYGGALPWPESSGRPARAAGALVVLAHGEPVTYIERGGKSIVTFPAAATSPKWPSALAARVTSGAARQVEIHTIDTIPIRTSPWADTFRAAGFTDGYRGLVIRR
ncbi:MAG TPA: DEAD/DEAH box helicase [Acidimicrobiales bacterium]|nr:DEAD/DEAH box helicase [Acidimicrobiales bacterium]